MINVSGTALDGVHVLTPEPRDDHRGWFMRLFCAEELRRTGVTSDIAQINRSFTRRAGTVRGMHFQHPPAAETKVVYCLQGKILDVALDLRRGSSTLGKHHAEELSSNPSKALVIPPGVAHGFQALTDNCELLYLHSAVYRPDLEDGVSPTDALFSIHWPLPVVNLSEKDRNYPPLSTDFKGICL